MAAEGRPRRPLEAKILDGSFRPDRHPDPATAVKMTGLPEPPEHLEDDERAVWDAIVPMLIEASLAKACDTMQLACLCEFYAEYRGLHRELLALKKAKADVKDRAAVQHMQVKVWREFDRLACRFGLTPSDRDRLSVEPPAKTEGGVATRKPRLSLDDV